MKQQLKTKRYIIESINLKNEDKLVISDPCYKLSEDTLIATNFREGKYFLILDVQQSPFNKHIYLNESVYLVHEDYMQFPNANNKDERYQGRCFKTSVDSGSLGIFKKNGYLKTHCENFIDKDWYKNLIYNEQYTFNENPLTLMLAHDKKSEGIIFSAHDDGTKDVYIETANSDIVYIAINLCGNLIIPDETYYYEGYKLDKEKNRTKFNTKHTIEREYFFYIDGIKTTGDELPFNITSLPNYKLINVIMIDKDKVTGNIENMEVHYFKSQKQLENYKKRKEKDID